MKKLVKVAVTSTTVLSVAPLMGHAETSDTEHSDITVVSSELEKVVATAALATTDNTYVANNSPKANVPLDSIQLLGADGKAMPTAINRTNAPVSVTFTLELKDLKKGDIIIVPFTSKNLDGNMFGSNTAEDPKKMIKGRGYSDKGLVFVIQKDIVGEAQTDVNIGAALGNGAPGFYKTLDQDGQTLKFLPMDYYFNGKLLQKIESTANPGAPFYSTFLGTGQTNGTADSINQAHYLSNATALKDRSQTSKQLGVDDMLWTTESKMNANDTFKEKTSTLRIHGFAYPLVASGDKLISAGVLMLPNGNKYNSIVNPTPEYAAKWKKVNIPDGTSRAEAEKLVRASGPMSYANVLSKDGKDMMSITYVGDVLQHGMKLSDTKQYVASGAKSPVECFEKQGFTFNDDAKQSVNDAFEKFPLSMSMYHMHKVNNGSIDHEVTSDLNVTIKDGYHQTTTDVVQKSAIRVTGQSSIQARYINQATKRDVSDAGSPVSGWPKGSEKNPDGKDKGTVQAKNIPGYILVKSPAGATNDAKHAITLDFPKENSTTEVIYEYLPIAKFVTTELSQKDKLPKYATDKTDPAKIKLDYVIPFVADKKAQAPDGKDLVLVDKADPKKGYVAPKIVDATKDTKINYVNAVSVTVKYVDKADSNKVLKTDVKKGFEGEKVGYATNDSIKSFTEKGFKLVSDNYPKDFIFKGNKTYVVTLDHGLTTHTPNDPKGMAKDELERTVTDTVKYERGTDKAEMSGTTPVSETMTFTRDVVTDNVTKKEVSNTGWKADKPGFAKVTSPKINGWIADKLVTEGRNNVAFDDKGRETIVTYVQAEQKGKVTFIDDDMQPNKDVDAADTKTLIIAEDALVGKSGEKSDYVTSKKIEELKALGYELVSDGFPTQGLIFDEDDATDQNFEVHLKHRHSPIKPEEPGKPGEPFDPNYPDGVKWPNDSDHVTQEKTRTINYVFEGEEDKNYSEVETRILSRTGDVDHVTGEMIWTEWPDGEAFNQFETPEVNGWTADRDVVDSLVVTHDMDNETFEIVTYTKNPDPENEPETDKPKENKNTDPEVKQETNTPPDTKSSKGGNPKKDLLPLEPAVNAGVTNHLTQFIQWMRGG